MHGLPVIVIIRNLEQLFAGGNFFPSKLQSANSSLSVSINVFFLVFFSLHTQCLS